MLVAAPVFTEFSLRAACFLYCLLLSVFVQMRVIWRDPRARVFISSAVLMSAQHRVRSCANRQHCICVRLVQGATGGGKQNGETQLMML